MLLCQRPAPQQEKSYGIKETDDKDCGYQVMNCIHALML
jgi:hypothetical protein